MSSITIRHRQKVFTEEEVSGLTGICVEHLRDLAQSRHLGFSPVPSGAVGRSASKLLFTNAHLMLVAALQERCEH